jgi:hypothetical protein
MSAHDTLRWGDIATIVNLNTLNAGFEGGSTLPSKQLVAAHWRWPLVWSAQFVVVPNLTPAETVSFIFQLQLVVGVGQGIVSYSRWYELDPPYNQLKMGIDPALTPVPTFLADNWELPAQDIQASVLLSTLGNNQPTGGPQESMSVAFLVAPVTEPHAMTAIHDKQVEGKGGPTKVEWMGPGFTPERLQYGGPPRR